MDRKCLTDFQLASKLVQPDRTGSARPEEPLACLHSLAGGGPVLVMTTQFGRSCVRDAAYRLRERCPGLDLKLSWRLFTSLEDWGKRWPSEQDAFAAGLILSAAGNPVIERAVGRCLVDLSRLGRPLLWGAISRQVRWQPRFVLTPNGWPPELILPHPATYARLRAANGTPEFRPWFDPILFSADPDYFVLNSRLRWREARNFLRVTRDG